MGGERARGPLEYKRRLSEASPCRFPDCERAAWSVGLCLGHYKQRARGRPLTPLAEEDLSHAERAVLAAIDLVECDSEDDLAFERARGRLLSSAEAWLKARGWRPPERGQEQRDLDSSRPTRGAGNL